MNKIFTNAIAAPLVAMVVACGSDPVEPASGATAGEDTSADAGARCSPTIEPFAATETDGLVRPDATSGSQVRIVSADHTPPDFGYNSWVLKVTDAAGAAVADTHVVWACAWMPAHLHGSNPREIIEQGDGRFAINNQNLSMYGEWQIRFWFSDDPNATPYQPQMRTDNRTGNACTPRDSALGASVNFDICIPRE
ncbi:MAG: FixH family protein [Polyangiales bacterium]